MKQTALETIYLEGQDGTQYQMIIIENKDSVEREGWKFASGYFEKLPNLQLFSYKRNEKYDQAKPSSPQKWIDVLGIPNAKWADEKKWAKIFESIPLLPPPRGVILPKGLGDMTLQEVCQVAITHADKYTRNQALEALFQVWGDKAGPAIAICQRVRDSAMAFGILIFGLKWNIRGIEDFARMVLDPGSAKITWLKFSTAIQFYAAAYLERVGQESKNIFPPPMQFLWNFIRFLYRATNAPDKAKEFVPASPNRAREVVKVLFTQRWYAALKLWCVGALQAGVSDGFLWKLLAEACKHIQLLGETKELVKQQITACEANAQLLGYAKADMDTLETISARLAGENSPQADVDVDEIEYLSDDEESDEEEEDDEESDEEEEDDEESDEEEDIAEGEARKDTGDKPATAVMEKRREISAQSLTQLFPQLSGTDILVEFFTAEGFTSEHPGKYSLPNQALLPWVVHHLNEPKKTEFLQKYFTRLLALIKAQDVSVASLSGAFRVAIKIAELLKVPEVIGMYAVVLDKSSVQNGNTGYLARRIVRTWKTWGTTDPDTFVRALTTFLAFYPPIDPVFRKDQERLVRRPFEPVKVAPPRPELMANVKELLSKVKPGEDTDQQRELLRQVQNLGDTVEGLFQLARIEHSYIEREKLLRKVISLEPNNVKLLLDAAKLTGRGDELIYLFKALELEPDNHAIYFKLGDTFSWRKRGLTYLKKAVELAPANSEYLNRLAEVLLRGSKFAEAMEVCKHALLLNPNDQKMWALLASCYKDGPKSPEWLYCIEKFIPERKASGGEIYENALKEFLDKFPEVRSKLPKELIISKGQMPPPRDPLQGMPKDAKLKLSTLELPGNYILVRFLLGNSKRLVRRYRQIRAGQPSILAEEAWQTREELFPEVWDGHPDALWTILLRAENGYIRDFCLRVLFQSPDGQAFLARQEVDQLLAALKISHARTHDTLLPFIRKRLEALPEVPQATFELLLRLETVKAWDLAAEFLVANKFKWTPRNLALIFAKSTPRMRELCQNNAHQIKAIQDDVAREFLELVAKGDVLQAALSFAIFEFKLNIPVGALVPLFNSKSQIAQNVLLELLSKWDPAERPLSAQELAAGLQHPEKKVREQVLRYLQAHLTKPSPELSEQVAGLISIIWSPYEDVTAEFPRLLDNFFAQNPTQVHLLLEHLVDQGAKRGVGIPQEKTFFEVVARVPLETWKSIDSKWIEDVVASASDDVRALGGLIAAQGSDRAITPAIVPLIVKSEQSILRRLLVDNLTKFPDLLVNQSHLLVTIIESDFDDLFAWGCQIIKDRGLPSDTAAPIADIFRDLLDSPVLRVRNFAFTFLSEKFEGNLPIDVVLRLLEHPAIDIRQRLASALGHYLERIVEQDPQLAIRYAKSVILVPNKMADAKDHVYQFLVDFANTAPKYRTNIKDLLLKIGAGSIIKDRERALSAFVRIQE